jgi:hypothetical protein
MPNEETRRYALVDLWQRGDPTEKEEAMDELIHLHYRLIVAERRKLH